MLVLIDQFEELFRFARRDHAVARSAAEAAKAEQHNDALAFVDLLLSAAKQRNPRVYIALTMRSDFLGE